MIKFDPFDRKQIDGSLGMGRGVAEGHASVEELFDTLIMVVIVWLSNLG